MADLRSARYSQGMLRAVLLLAGVVAVIGGGVFAVESLQPAPPPPKPGPVTALPVLGANERLADRIEVVQGERILWLERRGQVWGLSQAGGYPVRAELANGLIDALIALKLDHAADGVIERLGVADPTATEGAGTLVRVLAVSGAVLAAIILGPETGPPYVRRPGQPTVFVADSHVVASADPAAWLDRHLPPPDVTQMRFVSGDGVNDLAVRRAFADQRFILVRASPQVHPTPIRSIVLDLPDGSATLAVGWLDGRPWLQFSGTSAWAMRLAPYAFAIPPDSPLALRP